jgi:hypothetical protein
MGVGWGNERAEGTSGPSDSPQASLQDKRAAKKGNFKLEIEISGSNEKQKRTTEDTKE